MNETQIAAIMEKIDKFSRTAVWLDGDNVNLYSLQLRDELESALRSIGESSLQVTERAVEWMPIETAPKDGTRIWAIGNNGGDREGGVHYVECLFERNNWRENSHEAPFSFLTHWMPLPNPPAALLEQSK